jgi:anti-sigma-K factor RskA
VKTHVLIHPRAEELLVERALRPLTDAELAELASLGVADDDTVDLAAAALAVATLRVDEMPAELIERIAAEQIEVTRVSRRTMPGLGVPEVIAEPPPARPVDVVPIRPRRRAAVMVPWAIAAAASVALAFGAWRYTRPGISPADGRAELLASTTALAWTATPDPAAKGASGDVVWSQAEQRGYMRFVGLAVNDPTAWQYQLWIFDATRDQAFPVDGGVFDVTSTGEVIVPISAKLHVTDATLFAVTVEKPGGVVVSKRERIVVTAKPS